MPCSRDLSANRIVSAGAAPFTRRARVAAGQYLNIIDMGAVHTLKRRTELAGLPGYAATSPKFSFREGSRQKWAVDPSARRMKSLYVDRAVSCARRSHASERAKITVAIRHAVAGIRYRYDARAGAVATSMVFPTNTVAPW